jgi:hypothetical protein
MRQVQAHHEQPFLHLPSRFLRIVPHIALVALHALRNVEFHWKHLGTNLTEALLLDSQPLLRSVSFVSQYAILAKPWFLLRNRGE